MKLRFALAARARRHQPHRGPRHDWRGQRLLSIGALVRHKDCERSDALQGRYGVLGDAAPQISDPIVRNRGTVVGCSPTPTRRETGARRCWRPAHVSRSSPRAAPHDSARRALPGPVHDEPAAERDRHGRPGADPGASAGGTYLKLERKVGDYATVGVAVHLSFDNGTVGRAGIALTGVGPEPRAETAEAALAGAELNDDTIKAAAELAAEAAQPRERRARERRLQAERRPRLHGAGLRKAAETAQAA